jgi:glutamate mutase epsilon subunit
MATKKITLNELRTLVKQIIKEENNFEDKNFEDIIKYYGFVKKENKTYKSKYDNYSLYFEKLPIFDIYLDNNILILSLKKDPLIDEYDNHYVEKLSRFLKNSYKFDILNQTSLDKLDYLLKRTTDKILN